MVVSPRRLGSAAIIALLLVSGCSTADGGAAPDLAFAAPSTSALQPATPTTRPGPTTTADPTPPIGLGSPEQPFGPLPETGVATAVVSPSGVVMPVVAGSDGRISDDSWLVATACADVRWISGVEPLGRAHVVLDPGHGGREPGAVGPAGLVEKDLNLAVAEAAAAKLRELGATVVLTRTTDVTMTTGTRAMLARTVDPVLFLSVHHNGGAPANGDRPGTIVFTKAGSEASRRAGGLVHEILTTRLAEVGRAEMDRRAEFVAAATAHETAVADYDRSVAEREAALVANGQLDPAATTSVPEPVDPADADYEPSSREPTTPVTVPIPADRTPVAVPNTIPVPTPLEAEPVPEFRWAGVGNAGVRAWTDDAGADMLSVIRRSDDVPAALVEFLYVTNPVEEALLADPATIELEAQALADGVVAYFTSDAPGSGFVADEVGDQDIGGGGHRDSCVEPGLGLE